MKSCKIRKVLEEWHATGILSNNKQAILEAYEAYKRLEEDTAKVPGMDALRTHIFMEISQLERIIDARGYNK